jgi:hypothetical protein
MAEPVDQQQTERQAMNTLKVATFVSILSFFGCASTTSPGFVAGAPVTVTVTPDKDIVVDQEPIHVRAQDVVLNWTLVSQIGDYRFTSDGISIDKALDKNGNPVPIPAGEFDCSVHAQGKKFQCKDKNSTHATPSSPRYYKYRITVRDFGSAPVITLDPWINNH